VTALLPGTNGSSAAAHRSNGSGPQRGLVPDIAVAHPLGEMLPSLYLDDEFAQQLCAGLDQVLAAAVGSLDSVDAYIDPALAPPDFLVWLAGWVGLLIDETWPEEQQRRFVTEAVDLYRWRGTIRGLAGLVKIYVGIEPEIAETGAVSWSSAPGGPLPGRASRVNPALLVRVRVPDPSAVDQRRLTAIVAAATPAHVPYKIEVRQA
jgi:phage tail-like protein